MDAIERLTQLATEMGEIESIALGSSDPDRIYIHFHVLNVISWRWTMTCLTLALTLSASVLSSFPRCWVGVVDQIDPPWVSIVGERGERVTPV